VQLPTVESGNLARPTHTEDKDMTDAMRDAQEIFEQLTQQNIQEWNRTMWEYGLGALGYSTAVIEELDAMIQEARR
jgi:hypothetical protein